MKWQIKIHLLWSNDGRIFTKPLLRFLLDPKIWSDNLSLPPAVQDLSGGKVGEKEKYTWNQKPRKFAG
jgi:hypothetical protein